MSFQRAGIVDTQAVFDLIGRGQVGVSVKIYDDAGLSTVSTLYATNSLSGGTVGNPFTTNSVAMYPVVYATVGDHWVQATIDSVVQSAFKIHVRSDASELDSVLDKTTTGKIGLRLATNDGGLFVSANGNDANDGLSPGSAKATVQAAINALPANGGEISCWYGTFSIPTLTATDAARITIRGRARDATVLQSTATASADCFTLTGTNPTPKRRFVLEDLTFRGNGASSRYGLYIGDATEFVMQRVLLSNHGDRAVFFDGSVTGGTFRHSIRDCTFSANLKEAVYGTTVNSVLLEGCYFNGNCTSAGVGQSVWDSARGITHLNCTWDGASAPVAGVVLGTAADGTILGCSVIGGYMENQVTGIKVGNLAGANNALGVVIQGLEIFSASSSTRSIVVDKASQTVISGCYFYNNTGGALAHIGTTANAADTMILPCGQTGTSGTLTDASPLGTRTWVFDSNGVRLWTGGAQQGGFDATGRIFSSANAGTATTGASGATPAQVAGYMIINTSGAGLVKVPYYNL